MPGDVVRRCMPGQRTQKGYCRAVDVTADVWVKGSACILRGVRATRLRALTDTIRDHAVCLDSWVGSSKQVQLKLVLRTANGSVLEYRPDTDVTSLWDEDTAYRKGFYAITSFYPGQTLLGCISMLNSSSVKWLTTAIADVRNAKSRVQVRVRAGLGSFLYSGLRD